MSNLINSDCIVNVTTKIRIYILLTNMLNYSTDYLVIFVQKSDYSKQYTDNKP